MSDVLASSCCGRPIFKKRIPFTYQQRNSTAVARAFYAWDGCNRMAADSDGDRTAHYAPLRLHGAPPGAPEPPPETMATVPGDVISSWHGTGVGEISGWSGAWLGPHKPVFAHFVGGDASGSKVALMQALGMWNFGADEVVAHVRRSQRLPTNDTAVSGVLPPQLLQDHCGEADAHLCWAKWALREGGEGAVATGGSNWGGAVTPATAASRAGHAADDVSRLRLLELSGVGATPVLPTGAAFLRHDLRARARLATLGALLRRVTVRPRAHCDSPWAVMQKKGFRAVWQTPGERWPFAGVGIAIGRCGGGGGAPDGADNDEADGGGDAAAGGGDAAVGDSDASYGGEPAVAAPSVAPPDETRGQFCCTPIYGRHIDRRQASCIGTVHASLSERQAALLASDTPASAAPLGIATLAVSELPRTADGAAIDAARALALLSSPPYADAHILRIRLDAGQSLPPISPLPPEAAKRAASLFHGVCVAHAALAKATPTAAELNASDVAFAHDLREVGVRLSRKAGKAKGVTLGHIVQGREEFGLGNASSDAWLHYRAWKAQPKLSKVY
jgi:hypothetical protein